MGTGFSPERAKTHDRLVHDLVAIANERGWKSWELDPVGLGPDFAQIRTDGSEVRVDVKSDEGPNIDIAVRSYWDMCLSEIPTFVVVARYVLADLIEATVYNPYQLRAVSGPRPPSGNGSKTDYQLYSREGGTDFYKWCPIR